MLLLVYCIHWSSVALMGTQWLNITTYTKKWIITQISGLTDLENTDELPVTHTHRLRGHCPPSPSPPTLFTFSSLQAVHLSLCCLLLLSAHSSKDLIKRRQFEPLPWCRLCNDNVLEYVFTVMNIEHWVKPLWFGQRHSLDLVITGHTFLITQSAFCSILHH